MAVSYSNFLKELHYPVFVNNIAFRYEDLNRGKPKWWWRRSSKTAFTEAHSRLNELWHIRLSPFFEEEYLSWRWYYSVRDYLNSGSVKDFPKTNDPVIVSHFNSKIMNKIIGEKNARS